MKRIYILLIVLTYLLSACNKADKSNVSPASVRMQEAVESTQKTLLSSDKGWLLKIYPDEDKVYGGYNVWLKFYPSYKVEAVSELGEEIKSIESTYKINYSSGPTISFDTYNENIHKFSKPQEDADPYLPSLYPNGVHGNFVYQFLTFGKDTLNLLDVRFDNVDMSIELVKFSMDECKTYLSACKEMDKHVLDSFEFKVNDEVYRVERKVYDIQRSRSNVAKLHSRVLEFKGIPVQKNKDTSSTLEKEDATSDESTNVKLENLRYRYITTDKGIEFKETITLRGVSFKKLIYKEVDGKVVFTDESGKVKLEQY